MRELRALWKARKELRAFLDKVQAAGKDKKFTSQEFLTLYKPFMAFYKAWMAARGKA
jgi:hypothetical protein